MTLASSFNGQSLCVFCGSSSGNHARYMQLATETGQQIAQHGYRLVYGGGLLGLMGAVATAAHDSGGEVLGIIPKFLEDGAGDYAHIPHRSAADMHTRKTQMYEEADAFIVLPGGIGTLEEAVEVISWMRLELHNKPIIFLDSDDYWAPMLALIDHIIAADFSPAWINQHIFKANTPTDAIDLIKSSLGPPSQD